MSLALTPLPRRVVALTPALPVVAVPALLALPRTPDGAGPADVLSGLVVVYCVIRLLRERRRPLSPAAAVVLGLPVVGLAIAAMGAFSSQAGLTGLGRYLQTFVLVPAAVLLLLRDRAGFRLVAWSFVGLGLCQGAVGVHQFVTRTGASYQGANIRAVGTFGPQDVMGMATAVSLGLVCAIGIALGRVSVRQRVTAVGCALVLLLPLALSFSRGAWIATVLTCTMQLVLAGWRRALKVVAAAVASGVILVGGFGVGSALLQQRIDSIAQVADAPDQSVVDRYTLWASATDIWRQHPLTGVGLKGFPEYRDGHASLALSSGSETDGAGGAYQRQPLLSPHNMYLLVLSRAGPDRAARARRELAGAAGVRGAAAAARPRPRAGTRLRARRLRTAGLAADRLRVRRHRRSLDRADAVGMGLVAWWALSGDARADLPRGGVRERAEEAPAR